MQRLLAHREPQLTVRSTARGRGGVESHGGSPRLGGAYGSSPPPSRRPLSIGTTLLLAALNRAVWPCSKRGWAAWAQRTSLPHLFTLRPAALTSQYFWDQMDAVSESALEAIEADLTRKVIQAFHFTLDTLFYDTTNFFTYIASGNERSALAQRPLQAETDRPPSVQPCPAGGPGRPDSSHAQVYEGNVVDAQQFPDSLTAIRQRVERIVGHIEDLTLVYDKGNNSKTNQALVDAGPGHYVASLVPKHYPDLMAIPTRVYTPLALAPSPDGQSIGVNARSGGPSAPSSCSSAPRSALARCGAYSNN